MGLFRVWQAGVSAAGSGSFRLLHPGRPAAEWIAWILEEPGHYRVLVQAWDFVPGRNWIAEMQAGTRDAARTIAVLSEAYLDSQYGGAEWQAAWAADPGGAARPIRRPGRR